MPKKRPAVGELMFSGTKTTARAMAARNNQLPSAVRKVLGTSELLEHILVSLDFNTLLLARRVNGKFRDVIKEIDKLQKKLFLRPVVSIEEALELGFADEDGLLMRGRQFGREVNLCLSPVFINHHVFEPNRGFKLQAALTKAIDSTTHVARGSWTDMLITQPPMRDGFWMSLMTVRGEYMLRSDRRASTCRNFGYMVDRVKQSNQNKSVVRRGDNGAIEPHSYGWKPFHGGWMYYRGQCVKRVEEGIVVTPSCLTVTKFNEHGFYTVEQEVPVETTWNT